MTTDDLDPISDELLDALVDGTLDENRRRTLLLSMDAEPEAWRRCALAFLESQAWTQALAPMAEPVRAPLLAPIPLPRRITRPLRLLARSGIAAGLLALAFGAGRSSQSPIKIEPPAVAISPPVSAPVVVPPPVELADIPEAETSLAPYSPIPGHVLRQLDAQGYKVEQYRELVAVSLEDGTHVAVPIDQVSLEYVGNPPL